MTGRPRAAIVVTGSELVRGDRKDLNGPYLAAEALRLGLEPERITIVGDRPDDIADALGQAFGADLCLVSGGLGPTHDDRTVELVARVAGRALVVDEELEREIEAVSQMIAERLRRPYSEFAPGVRKQATRPEGAISVGLAGTAPGLVLETNGCVVVVLPGPPGELRRLWQRALELEPVQRVLARAPDRGRRTLRFFGTPESAVAEVLASAGGDGDGVEATICAREFEIHVDLVVEPGAEARADALEKAFRTSLARYLFSTDDRSVAEIVLDLARARGVSLATAESCTGGLVAARLTAVPGSSDVFRGGVVAYADDVKEDRAAGGTSCPRRARRGLCRDREGDGGRCTGTTRCRCLRVRHRNRGAGRRNRGEAGRARLPARSGTRWRSGAPNRPAGRPGHDSRSRDGCRASSSAPTLDTEPPRRRVSSRATLEPGGSLRLFLALLLPASVVETLERWSAEHLVQGRRVASFHVTLAFLGSRQRSELEPIVEELRNASARARPFTLEPERYRETRSVGMVVLHDSTGEATRLADGLHGRLEELGSYRREARPWLPHITVLRYRDRPRLSPPLAALQAEVGHIAPSEAAAFLSRLHPSGARYEILERCTLNSNLLGG